MYVRNRSVTHFFEDRTQVIKFNHRIPEGFRDMSLSVLALLYVKACSVLQDLGAGRIY